MEIGYKFEYEMKKYDEIAEWCNTNECTLEESYEDGKYFYTIVKLDNSLTEEEELNHLRKSREYQCFSIINRGQLWYNTLTEAQIQELNQWYQDWLDVTETKVIPTKLSWL